ncbi:GNAT family N-acetyltransferase [Pseudoalteromonas luteoviolacea]|uniref:GNAT family N-acetyltransferase n=1 Tax=Pseudoalteromonas luteoviolacea TaxID=43657 RepID=UPI00069073B7|nr:GNAT family N-acetyltransferase [Pseudoalteromonas luteoviolacea]
MIDGVTTASLRCEIREANVNDVSFILRLLNQQSFIEHIGDRQVKDHQSAVEYITQSFLMKYELESCAPYIICLKSGEAIGIAGFYQRPYLQHPDLGYAFLDEYTGQGYALEVCEQLLAFAKQYFNLTQLHAITGSHNTASQKLLNKLGFNQIGKIYVQTTDKADYLFTHYFD